MNLDLQTPRRHSGDANIIPMINIVFLLLVFFMVAGQIKSTNSTTVELPSSPVGAAAEEHKITLVMDRDSQLSLNESPIALESLDSALDETLIGNDSIALLADKTVKADELDKVLAILRARGIAKVSLFSDRAEIP